MAKLTGMMWKIGNQPIVVRFLGTTGESGTTRNLLKSLCTQLKALSEDTGTPVPSVSIP